MIHTQSDGFPCVRYNAKSVICISLPWLHCTTFDLSDRPSRSICPVRVGLMWRSHITTLDAHGLFMVCGTSLCGLFRGLIGSFPGETNQICSDVCTDLLSTLESLQLPIQDSNIRSWTVSSMSCHGRAPCSSFGDPGLECLKQVAQHQYASRDNQICELAGKTYSLQRAILEEAEAFASTFLVTGVLISYVAVHLLSTLRLS